MDIRIILGHGPFSHVFEDKVLDGILDDDDPKKKKWKASEAITVLEKGAGVAKI